MRSEKNYNNKDKKNKSLEDYAWYVCSTKQASDFEVTTKFIINHIQENFDNSRDIAEALRTLNYSDSGSLRPPMQRSVAEGESARHRENRELEFVIKVVQVGHAST